MKLFHLLLALTISYTNPSMHAGPNCSTSQDTLRDLQSVKISGTHRGETVTVPLCTVDARGQEGMKVFVTLTLPHDTTDVWTLTVIPFNSSGVEGCAKLFGVNLTLDAPPVIKGEKEEWYDIAGRRLRGKPMTSGIYVYVHGRVHQKVVIFH